MPTTKQVEFIKKKGSVQIGQKLTLPCSEAESLIKAGFAKDVTPDKSKSKAKEK
jgi:hypothetical protein